MPQFPHAARSTAFPTRCAFVAPAAVVIHSRGACRLSHPSTNSPPRSRPQMPDPFVYTSDRLRVLFGRGTVARIAKEAEHHKMGRVMLLCSRGRAELAQRVAAPLGA